MIELLGRMGATAPWRLGARIPAPMPLPLVVLVVLVVVVVLLGRWGAPGRLGARPSAPLPLIAWMAVFHLVFSL